MEYQTKIRFTALLRACRDGRVEKVDELSNKENVNLANADGFTPIHMASIDGHLNTLKLLFSKGADPCRVTKKKSNALHLAIKYHFNPVSVRELLRWAVPIDAKDNLKQTPLLIAVLREMPDMVKSLVENGADICAVDRKGRSPVHHACLLKNLPIMKMLLEKLNPDVKKKLRSLKDCNGLTPAHIASSTGMADILEVLIYKDCVNYTICDGEKQSVIITACKEKHVNCTRMLLEHLPSNVDISQIKDARGNNLLHIACQLGETDLIPVLIRHGVSVRELNSVHQTPVGCALAQKQDEACELVAPASFPDCQPVSRLHEIHMAAMFGRDILLKDLIGRKLNIFERDEHGSNLLHSAASHGHKDTVKLLLDAGVNPLELNTQGKTAADLAEFVGHNDIAELLKTAENKDRDNQTDDTGVCCDANTKDDIYKEENEQIEKKREEGEKQMEIGEAIAAVRMASRAMRSLPRTSECEDISCVQTADHGPDNFDVHIHNGAGKCECIYLKSTEQISGDEPLNSKKQGIQDQEANNLNEENNMFKTEKRTTANGTQDSCSSASEHNDTRGPRYEPQPEHGSQTPSTWKCQRDTFCEQDDGKIQIPFR